MDIEEKKKIVEYINENDPDKELIIEIRPNGDYSGGVIKYNKNNLIIHRNISELNDEEYIRAFLVVRLAKELKYPSKCIELEKEYELVGLKPSSLGSIS